MNIAYKLMAGQYVSVEELKYLLWLSLTDRQRYTNEETLGADLAEVFNVEDLLKSLEKELTV
jgi:hypothetical protein